VSNDVLVTGCNAINIKSDFVEANCVGAVFNYTAVGGETSVTITSVANRYIPGAERVRLNGVTLTRGVDYTALDGQTVTFINPPSLLPGAAVIVNSPRSKNWAITNNVFEQSSGYPIGGTETRFIGITAVYGVVIDGNVATNCNGDAFVHLEDNGGECIISNNYFENLASGFGLIFLIASGWHCIITGNTFKQTDPKLTKAIPCVYSSNDNTNDITFTNNRVIGNVGGVSFRAFGFSFQTGRKIIANNIFQNLTSVLSTPAVSNCLFSGNVVRNCQSAITANSVSGSGSNYTITNNVFEGTQAAYDIDVFSSSSTIRAPRNWIVQGNRFSKGARFAGNGAGGGNGEIRDIYVSNNILGSGATGIVLSGTRTRVRESGNTSEVNAFTKLNFSTAGFEPQSVAPTSPTRGEVYYDNPTNKLRLWNGTAWVDLN
jgi:hypothetical protein